MVATSCARASGSRHGGEGVRATAAATCRLAPHRSSLHTAGAPPMHHPRIACCLPPAARTWLPSSSSTGLDRKMMRSRYRQFQMSTHCQDPSLGERYGTRGTPMGIMRVTCRRVATWPTAAAGLQGGGKHGAASVRAAGQRQRGMAAGWRRLATRQNGGLCRALPASASKLEANSSTAASGSTTDSSGHGVARTGSPLAARPARTQPSGWSAAGPACYLQGRTHGGRVGPAVEGGASRQRQRRRLQPSPRPIAACLAALPSPAPHPPS